VLQIFIGAQGKRNLLENSRGLLRAHEKHDPELGYDPQDGQQHVLS
jgi:hypothetical protein